MARDGVTDVIVRVETDDGAGGLGRGLQRRRRRARSRRRSRRWRRSCSAATRGTARRCATTCTRTGCGSSAPAPATSPGPGSTWRSPTSCGAAPPACRCTSCSAACGAARSSYFYYLARGERRRAGGAVPRRPAAGLRRASTSRSASTARRTCAMVAAVRAALGPGPRLRLDANGGLDACRGAARCSRRWPSTTSTSSSSPSATTPSASWPSCGARLPMAVCANEGLWSEADAYARIVARAGRRLLLQPVLGRLARRVPPPRARRAPRGAAGLQAHARRARPGGGRRATTCC